MDTFLEKYNLPKLNQKGTENMNRPNTSTDIEIIINKIFQEIKAQGQIA